MAVVLESWSADLQNNQIRLNFDPTEDSISGIDLSQMHVEVNAGSYTSLAPYNLGDSIADFVGGNSVVIHLSQTLVANMKARPGTHYTTATKIGVSIDSENATSPAYEHGAGILSVVPDFYAADNTQPVIGSAVIYDSETTGSGEPFAFNLVFNEPVDTLTAGNLSVSNEGGAPVALSSGTTIEQDEDHPNHYKVLLDPADVQHLDRVYIDGVSLSDWNGNPLAAGDIGVSQFSDLEEFNESLTPAIEGITYLPANINADGEISEFTIELDQEAMNVEPYGITLFDGDMNLGNLASDSATVTQDADNPNQYTVTLDEAQKFDGLQLKGASLVDWAGSDLETPQTAVTEFVAEVEEEEMNMEEEEMDMDSDDSTEDCKISAKVVDLGVGYFDTTQQILNDAFEDTPFDGAILVNNHEPAEGVQSPVFVRFYVYINGTWRAYYGQEVRD